MGDASGVMGYGRRRPELCNAPLRMKQDTYSLYNSSNLTWASRTEPPSGYHSRV